MKSRFFTTGLLAVAAILFSLNSNAQITIDFSLNKDTLCLGTSDTLHLTDLSSTVNGNIISWYWIVYQPNAVMTSTLQNPSFSGFLFSGTFDIGLMVLTDLGDSAFAVPHTIHVLPQAFTAGPDKSICSGNSVLIGVAGQNISNPEWFPTSGLSCSTCDTTLASPVVTTDYVLWATDSNGCRFYDTMRVDVLNNAAQIDPVPQLCTSGGIYQLNVNPWMGYNFSGNYIDSFGVFDPAASGVGIHTVYYTTTAPGCNGVDSVDIEVIAPPTVDAGTSTTFCVGDTLISVPIITSVNPVAVEYNLNGIVVGNGPMLSHFLTDTTSLQLLIVTVTDSVTNCTNSDTVTIFINNLTFTISSTEDSCGNGNGTATVVPNGGQAPYNIIWSNGDTTFAMSGLNAGLYNFTITDNTFCSAGGAIDIIPYPSGYFYTDSTKCAGDTINLYGVVNSGPVQNFIFLWDSDMNVLQDSIANTVGFVSGSGNYSVTISDLNGCSNSFSTNISSNNCVWPGDANYDGIANNLDVLNIGIAYGVSSWGGRANASINWIPQFDHNWNFNFSNGVDYKHADCNGDSTINSADTVAISQNYGLTHYKYYSSGRMTDPPLYVDQPDSIYPSDTVMAPIIFGEATNMVSNAYGVAFTVLYDNTIVDSATMHLQNATSWLGALGNDLIKFSKDDPAAGKLDIAYVRTNQQNIPSGFGQIGVLRYILQDDISGKISATTPHILSVVNIKAISADESKILIFGKSDTAAVVIDETGITAPDRLNLMLYPNPVHSGQLFFAADVQVELIEILDIQGRLVYREKTESSNGTIDVQHLSNGVYLIKVYGKKDATVQKMVISR